VTRDRLALDPHPRAADPEVGRWLAALEEARRDTLQVLAEIPPRAIDREPDDHGDTLGTVLYHVALIEADWVFTDVLDREADIPDELFPYDDRLEDGTLTPISYDTFEQHLDRLARVRSMVLDALRPISAVDFHRVRSGVDVDVTAAWAVFHLIDHEVEHRVRISALRDAFRD